MREIKFRGKDIKTGEWRYGFYAEHRIHNFDTAGCRAEGYTLHHAIYNDSEGERGKGGYWHEIDPETFGQFTGLKDKNGVEIYEGDIVETVFPYKYAVKFFDGAFIRLQLPRMKYVSTLTKGWEKDICVIGNIYDNPELLKNK
jgi:uncharacterized phage protein (TIGR01671 family)